MHLPIHHNASRTDQRYVPFVEIGHPPPCSYDCHDMVEFSNLFLLVCAHVGLCIGDVQYAQRNNGRSYSSNTSYGRRPGANIRGMKNLPGDACARMGGG